MIPGVTPEEDLKGLQALVRRLGEPCCVEVGSFTGQSALAMIQAGASKVFCIDTWQGGDDPSDMMAGVYAEHGSKGVFDQFCKTIGPELLLKRVFPVVGRSTFFAPYWPWQADLIFIDADHRYDAVMADIQAWEPLVRLGGILCGHDYEDYWPGVKRAIDETGGCKLVGRTVWYREK